MLCCASGTGIVAQHAAPPCAAGREHQGYPGPLRDGVIGSLLDLSTRIALQPVAPTA